MPAKKKPAKPILVLNLEPYPWVLYLTDNRESHQKIVTDRRGIPVDSDRLKKLDGMCSIHSECNEVYVGIFCTNYLDIVVHELAHVAIELFNGIGTEINHDTTEPFAYLMGFMFNECRDALAQRRKKKKPKLK